MVTRNEIHVFLRGGLGNQLYQYIVAKDLSVRFSKNLVLREDLLPLEKDAVAGVTRWPNQLIGFRHSGTVLYRKHQPPRATNLFGKLMQLMRVFGDWLPSFSAWLGWLSSEKSTEFPKTNLSRLRIINSYSVNKNLIAENREAIREELENLVSPSDSYLELKAELSKSPKTIVHIRKGDYQELTEVYGVITTDYYRKALKILSEEKSLNPIWIFTDTPSGLTAEEIAAINPERIVSPAEIDSPLENLLLMSRGASFITSNSTYSWWASQLSEKGNIIVAPIMSRARINNFDEKNEPHDTLVFITVE